MLFSKYTLILLSTAALPSSSASPLNISKSLDSLQAANTNDNELDHFLYRRQRSLAFKGWEIAENWAKGKRNTKEPVPVDGFTEGKIRASDRESFAKYQWIAKWNGCTLEWATREDLENTNAELYLEEIERNVTVVYPELGRPFFGKGGYGKVYKGTLATRYSTGIKTREVAVKEVNPPKIDMFVLAGGEIQRQLSNIPGIMEAIDYFYVREDQFLVMPLVDPPYTLLDTKSKSQTEKWEIFLSVVKTVAKMHGGKFKVAHLDLKSKNIMYTPNWDYPIQIIDFDMATKKELVDNYYGGTLRYMAPEVLALEQYNTFKEDIFALGMIFMELRIFNGNQQKFEKFYKALIDKHFATLKERGRWMIPEEVREFVQEYLKEESETEPNEKLTPNEEDVYSHQLCGAAERLTAAQLEKEWTTKILPKS